MKDERVLILGLGASGLAMARWCARQGAQVRVWDSRHPAPGAPGATGAPDSGDTAPHADTLAREWPAVQVFGGALTGASLGDATLVLKSPGLAPGDERIAPLMLEARTRDVPVQGELDCFVKALAALKAEHGYAPRLVAITGTNGKTTTTAMTALIVERTGRRVGLAGNIGPTLLDTLAAAEAAGEALPDVWVMELSSFQLEGGGRGVEGFEPDAAAVLNVTQDHLDWHGSMAAYAQAKSRIYGRHAVMVVNRDDALVEAMVPQPPAAAEGRAKGKAPKWTPRHVVRFGLDAPRQPGDFGLVQEGGMAWLVRALPDEEGTRKRGERAAHDEPAELHLQRLMPADALRVRGRHNAANALAALALATAIGCPLAPMLHGLREYAGEPHRVQFIASVGGVEAYDDSKGTNVGATVAALEGLGADKSPAKLVVILGGDGKGQDFAPLAVPCARHARAVATLGRDAEAIEQALAGVAGAAGANGVPLQRHATLEAATAWCFEQAQPGDAVLLSPACASLDMFRNYAHRAEVFVQAVQALAAARGEV